jgi:hypothetical protein
MPDDTAYVLSYINELRRDYGLGMPLNRIPPGATAVSGSCPIAVALRPARVAVGFDVIVFTDLDEEAEIPSRIRRFILDFDRGEYPDLIDDGLHE